MASKSEKYKRRRLRSAYLSVVISIALVLYLLGIFAVLVQKAGTIANEVKENFAFTILLNSEASPVTLKQFQKELELSPFVKSTTFISKEEAAADFQQALDEQFVDFLGYNPLLDAIDLRLKAEYVDAEKIKQLEAQMLAKSFVREIVYDQDLVVQMNQNIKRIGYILIGGSFLLVIVSISLINSSIRLAIYSSRFIIKTMQLVGATRGFVRRPFLAKSMVQGIWGAFIGFGLLSLTLYYAEQQVSELNTLHNYPLMGILLAGMLGAGLLITASCTFFALRKYLKMKPDQLYF